VCDLGPSLRRETLRLALLPACCDLHERAQASHLRQAVAAWLCHKPFRPDVLPAGTISSSADRKWPRRPSRYAQSAACFSPAPKLRWV